MASNRITPQDFLAQNGFEGVRLTPIPTDASGRRYFRFEDVAGQLLILMDAPPTANLKTDVFLTVTTHLADARLSVPKVSKQDLTQGYLVLTDLGNMTASDHLKVNPCEELKVYLAVLQTLHQIEPIHIPGLAHLDPKTAGDMVRIAAVEYADRSDVTLQISDLMRSYFEAFCDPNLKLALRDFHAENIIWRPEQQGIDRVGLIDYQDAFFAPAGYDLVSLIRDVRRDVSKSTQNELINRYMDRSGSGPEFRLQLHCLAIQRNLRVLGVFARLVRRLNKPKYANFLGRVWRLLLEDLQPVEFQELRGLIMGNFPEPDESLMQSWQGLQA